MKKIKMLTLAMGLSLLALQADRGVADTTCEAQCRANNVQCQITCSQNPCLISCDQQLQYCLDSCQ
jgi:hypothetical protein